MLVLISNDDGIHAPGIKALVKAIEDIADILVVAPLEERSTTAHALTLNRPLRLAKIQENRYGCNGYPADCIILALVHLLKNRTKPDLILTGINQGGNLGLDIYYSGTVAAAREGAFHGIPAIALSTTVEIRHSRANPTLKAPLSLHATWSKARPGNTSPPPICSTSMSPTFPRRPSKGFGRFLWGHATIPAGLSSDGTGGMCPTTGSQGRRILPATPMKVTVFWQKMTILLCLP